MRQDELFQHSDYKQLLKAYQKEARDKSLSLSWKRISEIIGLQNTYISRIFNSDHQHFSEDQLFQITEVLGFDALEREYIFLLRSLATTHNQTRKKYCTEQIQNFISKYQTKARLKDQKDIDPQDLHFLLDPFMMILYLGFHLERHRKLPFALGRSLGLSDEKIKTSLGQLEKLGLIELTKNRDAIKGVNANRVHYPPTHPLSRGHQQILRNLTSARLMALDEASKTSFMAGFNASEDTVEKIRKKFFIFLSEAQEMTKNEKADGVFQLNFDLFRWD